MSDTGKAKLLQLKARRAFGAFSLDCELALELGGDPRSVRPLRLR